MDAPELETSFSPELYQAICATKAQVAIILNKIDVASSKPDDTVRWAKQISKQIRNCPHVFALSAKTGTGFNLFEKALSQKFGETHFKNIYVVGRTNSGKSRFTNLLLNALGVRRRSGSTSFAKESNNLFFTREVGSYKAGSLTVVDTPGLPFLGERVTDMNDSKLLTARRTKSYSLRQGNILTVSSESDLIKIQPFSSCKISLTLPKAVSVRISNSDPAFQPTHGLIVSGIGRKMDEAVIGGLGGFTVLSPGVHKFELQAIVPTQIFRRPAMKK